MITPEKIAAIRSAPHGPEVDELLEAIESLRAALEPFAAFAKVVDFEKANDRRMGAKSRAWEDGEPVLGSRGTVIVVRDFLRAADMLATTGRACAVPHADVERTRWLIRQVLKTLPAKRDWLDPDVEREMREVVGKGRPPQTTCGQCGTTCTIGKSEIRWMCECGHTRILQGCL